jgi:hypothetical protein
MFTFFILRLRREFSLIEFLRIVNVALRQRFEEVEPFDGSHAKQGLTVFDGFL